MQTREQSGCIGSGRRRTMSVKEYKEYSYVLMKLWIGNLITDGEYNRIMDRVNAVWRQTERESE